MGSSIFADESGDESAREEPTDGGPPSVFRRRHEDGTGRVDDGTGCGDDGADGGREASDDRGGERDGDGRTSRGGDDESTMTVFSGGDVYEVGVDDE